MSSSRRCSRRWGSRRRVFGKLDAACKPEAILASNTSTLDVDEIASATGRPGQVIGTHFFSPANVMKLMENVRGAQTSPQTIATIMTLSKTLGKVGVLVGICDGFVGNRMLYAYRRQADFLLEEGALPQQIDKVIYDFGMPMGPYAMGDLAGLDVGWLIRKRQAATRPKHLRYSTVADRVCELGRFGQKTGAGWHRYEPGNRTPIPDPEIEQLIVSISEAQGITRREITDQEILERCLYPLVNEGAKILEEGLGTAARRHRHRLDLRLRLPALSRRPDVLGRSGRRADDLRRDESASRRARRLARAGAAAAATGRAGQGFRGALIRRGFAPNPTRRGFELQALGALGARALWACPGLQTLGVQYEYPIFILHT